MILEKVDDPFIDVKAHFYFYISNYADNTRIIRPWKTFSMIRVACYASLFRIIVVSFPSSAFRIPTICWERKWTTHANTANSNDIRARHPEITLKGIT